MKPIPAQVQHVWYGSAVTRGVLRAWRDRVRRRSLVPVADWSDRAVATVRLVFRGATARRTDLPASAEACVNGVGATHTHPSWREFAAFPLQAVPPDRYEISLADVPVGASVSLRVNDQNWCDRNPTGAVLQNVFANDVPLVQNTLTPGSGDEPGYAFTVDAAGRVRQ